MGLSQALSTGVSGLISHQKAMDNIGNNLANINTTGFKKGVYQFTTLLEQTLRSGMAGTDSRGSVNAIALGTGTQTGSISKVFTQGSLESSTDQNHMAIYGNGFFVLSTGNGYALTRDGTFYLDADGYLTGANGYYVQGTMAVKGSDGTYTIPQDSKLQDIVIPIGTTGGMAQTSKVSFTGNLNSTQSVSSGLNLYGTTSAPSVSNLQSWMSANNSNTDDTWSALQSASYVVSTEVLDLAAANGVVMAAGVSLASNVSSYTSGENLSTDLTKYSAYQAVDPATGMVVDTYNLDGYGNQVPWTYDYIINTLGHIPVVQEVSAINGGNVQTSAAFGITVPETLVEGQTYEYNGKTYTINNKYTYPAWFYEANGGDFEAVYGLTNMQVEAAPSSGWPYGFQGTALEPGTPVTDVLDLPRANETYPATLDTPLEYLMYWNGSKWTQPFASIKDGDEITVSFDKGDSTVTATFVYNRPSSPAAFGNQQKVDNEQSYTLEHFLTFMAGDVDNTGTACAAITPAMYGAIPDEEYPDGNPDLTVSPNFDKAAYEAALANVALATSDSNTNTVGGVMGLIDVAPTVSSQNGGSDDYDAPMETAGAFTREGVSQVTYQRWNSATGQLENYTADSFNISFVSNLGSANALSNIVISYNNVSNKTMFSAETEYAAEDGGSAMATVTFYDSLGNPQTATVRLALVEQDSNFSTWRWYADSESDSDFGWVTDPDTGEIVSSLNIGTGLFRFDSDGNFVAGSDYSETGGIVINLVDQGVEDPIVVSIINGLNSKETQDLDFSTLTFTNEKNSFTLETQNGYPPGVLESYSVSLDGTVYGLYSTGINVPIARLVLATVANEHGLVASGDNLYYTSPSSGDAQFGYPTLGGKGEIRQYYLETSNVDMAEEFTKLISIERGYQANSRVITTADEMLQELLSMKR